jgi:serine/threonine-protein kinase RsbW
MATTPAEPMPPSADSMAYEQASDLAAVRAFVRMSALDLGLPESRVELLALAVSELTTNTLQHTSGGGHVSVWTDRDQLVCDVVDRGAMRTFGPMPAAGSIRGRGLAIVERVSDEVSISSDPDGTLVRIRMNLATS